MRIFLLALSGLLGLASSPAQLPPALPVGAVDLSDWRGLQRSAFDGAGMASFRYPDGPKGGFNHGFRRINDSAADWSAYAGLAFDLDLESDGPVEVTVRLAPYRASRVEEMIAAKVTLPGPGSHAISLPWDAFAHERTSSSFLFEIKELQIGVSPAGTKAQLRNVRLVKGMAAALETAVRGKSAPAGGATEYVVTVSNPTRHPASVRLDFVRQGWEAMKPSVEPSELLLAAGESRPVTVRVAVPENIPPGGRETQTLQAIANGRGAEAATLALVTASERPHPYILHTPARWREVTDKVAAHPWAREAAGDYTKKADAWQVPEIATPPGNDPDDNMGPFLFRTQNETDLMACGIAYQLTGDVKYADKIKTFLLRLSDPERGYAKTLRGCNQGFVQEGHFFQHIAMAYDMALPAGIFNAAEREQIATALRVFMESVDRGNRGGAINNWNVSEIVGAFYCALVLQDLEEAERFFAGPSGIKDQLAKGTMDDGWWYECSISYNVWCASEFTQAALAYEAFGVNFKDMWVPASYSRDVSLTAPGGAVSLSGGVTENADSDYARRRPFGMSREIWGPIRRPYRQIRDLWNSLLPFLDYRGVMFGVNDSTERRVSGQPFEIAYYAYRDPAYAAVIGRGGGKRDLLYGVPELPKDGPERFRDSAVADNVGVVMLRSQTPDRPIRDQIQAVLHYGTHGWAHGHFDRTGLLSLMRYGRSFYNPEAIWYSYEPFMYKFYVQTSVSKNMVVVDRKMQEATESARRLFHSGRAMQATVVETNSRWSNPPYGGMVYDYVPVKSFAGKTEREGRFVPLPEDAPAYGTLSGFTEPILQRRAMVVTDDYVVLADYLRASEPHTFENLFQMKGFLGLEAPVRKWLRHDAQWDADPLGSAQFVTDANWYAVEAPAKLGFRMQWGPGADNEGTRAPESEDGPLNLDVYAAWPPRAEIMIATAPEEHGTAKRLTYAVRGDGKMLAEGKFGAWILGRGDLDVPLAGVKSLELESRTELSKKPTVFWGAARVVTRDGREIPLADLPIEFDNVAMPPAPNRDYFGGPVKITGDEFVRATPGQPADLSRAATVRVDLAGIEAVAFRATVGGDYPLGDEAQRRKTVAIRQAGRTARFLTVIEPFESTAIIKSVRALDADRVRVELTDGRTQEITLRNFEGDGRDLEITLEETRVGQVGRFESTSK